MATGLPQRAAAEKVSELGSVASIDPPLMRAGGVDPSEELLVVTERCFLDLASGGESLGRITVDLYGRVSPRTAGNFASLCRGTKNGVSYRGSTVFRVIPDLNIGMGDVAGGGDRCVKAGTCVSASGGPFPVENYEISHTVSGLVSMARGLDNQVTTAVSPQAAAWICSILGIAETRALSYTY